MRSLSQLTSGPGNPSGGDPEGACALGGPARQADRVGLPHVLAVHRLQREVLTRCEAVLLAQLVRDGERDGHGVVGQALDADNCEWVELRAAAGRA